MNSRNIPRFTAESSLVKSGGRYAFVTGRAAGTFGRAIPQLQWLGEIKKPCIPGCICVSPIGCPCCDSLGWPWPIVLKDLVLLGLRFPF